MKRFDKQIYHCENLEIFLVNYLNLKIVKLGESLFEIKYSWEDNNKVLLNR